MGFATYEVKSLAQDVEALDDTTTPNEIFQFEYSVDRPQALLSCLAANSGNADIVLTIHSLTGGVGSTQPVAAVTIPAGSGNGTLPIVNVLASIAPTPVGLFLAPSGAGFGVSIATAPSTGATCYIATLIGYF
jgi:hypothetical protein